MTKEKVLNILKGCSDYVSGELLSEKLGITRAAIWKNINSLRKDGYEIESTTNRGYKLIALPDVLTEQEISYGLLTNYIGKKIYAFDTIDSTNNQAKRQAQLGAPNGSIFIAEQQTGGKGRLGRNWSSPFGEGIWLSILLRPDSSPLHITNITLLTGLTVCKAIRNYTGCDAKIKWPNDIVIGSKKVCGILTEMTAEIDKIEYVIVGIGINVNISSFPNELTKKATSIKIECNKKISRVGLLQTILKEFESHLNQFNKENCDILLSEYKDLCVTLGRKISTQRNKETIFGTAVDITSTGELLVECDNGKKLVVNSGEVTVQGIYE